MATMKHSPSPFDEPPSASSSLSENDRKASSQKSEEEEDSSDEDSSSEEETEEVHTSIKPSPPTPTSNLKPASSQYESESGSESESESESDSKPKPEPTPPPTTKSGTKRSMGNTNTESDSKRSKKKKAIASDGSDDEKEKEKAIIVADDGSGSDDEKEKEKALADDGSGSDDEKEKEKALADDGSDDEKEEEKDFKKMSSHRLFSEEDELAILKGLADFISKTGKDPMKHTPAFYSFVKKSIQADANKEQLRRKVRSLKNKYESNGNFTKQHDKEAFELFQKIDFKNEEKTVEKGSPSVSKTVVNSLAFTEMVRFGDEMVRFGDELGLSGFNIPAMKRGMELIGESEKAVFRERWKKIQIAEMKLLMVRAELVRDQAYMTLETYENSN